MANEKRLIDANAIPWEEHYVPDGEIQWEYKKELCVCKPAIDQMPTVDAVEVVRCKDCKWWADDYCTNINGAKGLVMNGMWFCASGERRTEDG